MKDVAHVRYASVVVSPKRAAVHPLLVPSHSLLARWAGENDGLVPVASQSWGDVVGEADTDHWGAVGWSGAFDAPKFYATLLERLPAVAFSGKAPRARPTRGSASQS
jgi:hypothetical protein